MDNEGIESSSKNRIDYIDIAKGILIWLVVLGHILDEGGG